MSRLYLILLAIFIGLGSSCKQESNIDCEIITPQNGQSFVSIYPVEIRVFAYSSPCDCMDDIDEVRLFDNGNFIGVATRDYPFTFSYSFDVGFHNLKAEAIGYEGEKRSDSVEFQVID